MSDIEFHFDFGSPNAYLSHRVIPLIEQRTGSDIPLRARAAWAASSRPPTIVRRWKRFADIPAKRAFMELETRRFIARHGIREFRRNPFFPVNTLAIMRGAVAARHEGCFDRYVDIVYQAMWEQEKKMDDPAVIRAVLDDSGLDAERLMQRAQTPEVKQELVEATNASVARGTFGSPTFFVGNDMFFGKDQLRDVEEA